MAARIAVAIARPRLVFPKNLPMVIYPSCAWTLTLCDFARRSLIIRISSRGYSPASPQATLARSASDQTLAPGEWTRWRGVANAVMSAPRGRTRPRARAVLTRDILFGMNILTLAGFVVMGLTLTLNRMGQAGKGLSIGLITAGTALVFLGLYAGGWSG